MPCAHPLKGWRGKDGKITFTSREAIGSAMARVPCGQCLFCRRVRALSWSVRIMCEADSHPLNSFVTLTYAEDIGGLNVEHIQKFFKKFRKALAPQRVRYFACGEYGSKNNRAHWHVIIFGWAPSVDDRVDAGSGRFDSRLIQSCWSVDGKSLGFSSVGELTAASASYCAGYSLKKITGKAAHEHYLNTETGEYCRPETMLCSRRPGIGLPWFERHLGSVFPSDAVYFSRGVVRPPKYFFEKLKEKFPHIAEEVSRLRAEGFDEDEYYRTVWSGLSERVLKSREAATNSRHKEL